LIPIGVLNMTDVLVPGLTVTVLESGE